eukprot:jgi/Botrbrau1/733/Bobra.160_2s0056.1
MIVRTHVLGGIRSCGRTDNRFCRHVFFVGLMLTRSTTNMRWSSIAIKDREFLYRACNSLFRNRGFPLYRGATASSELKPCVSKNIFYMHTDYPFFRSCCHKGGCAYY